MNRENGFLKARDQKIYDGNGKEIVLRGVGLGNWLLPEGYMWKFYTKCDRPRRIEALILDLVGEARAQEFWEIFRDTFITEADIEKIAREGYNSIRLPINYRIIQDEKGELIEKGIAYVDRAIEWCAKYNIYVVLDLHGAPGGQTGTNIDDSLSDLPELFVDEKNRSLTIKLWTDLAKRYCDEVIVAGYDLLNEPLPNWFSAYNEEVMPLYQEITRAIRAVDSHHMIILEGVHWSTDWSIFECLEGGSFDDNYMLEFHKYWSNPDTESILPYLEKRKLLNVPIFMGEGGENNKPWYCGVFQMYEDLNISWNFWTWKKLDTNNSPCSIILPQDWELILSYISEGIKPDEETSWRILKEYLYNIQFKNCQYRDEVVDSMFRRIPVKIPAEYYSYLGKEVGFHREERKASVGLRSLDETGIFLINEEGKLNFQHYNGDEKSGVEKLYLEVSEGEWFDYTFNSKKDVLCQLSLRMAKVEELTKLRLCLDHQISYLLDINSRVWHEEIVVKDFEMKAGPHHLRLECQKGIAKVEWINLN